MRIALIQSKAFETPERALANALERIDEAAAAGAQTICTQELFLTPYFCHTQDPEHFALAEPIPGPTTEALQASAKKNSAAIIASLFEKRAPGLYHNTAVVIDADGSLLGICRKTHIPQDPGFEEKFYFTPGDTPIRAWRTAYGKVAALTCWDQWYPEAARLAALAGAEVIFYPTAIGWLPEEKASLGEAQRNAWETVQRGHAVANGCYVAAVNRVGMEARAEFWGQSFVSDFYGRPIAKAPADKETILHCDCDLEALEEFRRIWPFLRDRRPDAYGGLLHRFNDQEPT